MVREATQAWLEWQLVEVIKGGKDSPGFVCPWCGAWFDKRSELAYHFLYSTRCRDNRNVNSQLQTKYNIGEDPSNTEAPEHSGE